MIISFSHATPYPNSSPRCENRDDLISHGSRHMAPRKTDAKPKGTNRDAACGSGTRGRGSQPFLNLRPPHQTNITDQASSVDIRNNHQDGTHEILPDTHCRRCRAISETKGSLKPSQKLIFARVQRRQRRAVGWSTVQDFEHRRQRGQSG
jgi:hypothetical protein